MKENKVLILLIALFLNLLLMSNAIILKNDRSLFMNFVGLVVSPVQVGSQKVIDFVGQKIDRFFFLGDIYHKYMDLKQKNIKLKIDNYYLKRKLEELGFDVLAKRKFPNATPVDLVSINRNFPFHTIIINKGRSHKIEKNMVVVNMDGQLVGKVIEPITPFVATVKLITSPSEGVGAYIEKNKLEGFLSGKNDFECIFKYLLENQPVAIGDKVVTSGTDKIFAPYIPIGEVIRIEKEVLTQKVFVAPYFIKKPLKHLIVLGRD